MRVWATDTIVEGTERQHPCAHVARVVVRREKVCVVHFSLEQLVGELRVRKFGANVGSGDELEKRGVCAT